MPKSQQKLMVLVVVSTLSTLSLAHNIGPWHAARPKFAPTEKTKTCSLARI